MCLAKLHRTAQVIALACALASFSTPSHSQTASEAGALRIAPGDRISIAVLGQSELSSEVMVDAAGVVPMPLIGDVAVQGLTAREVEKQVGQKLSDGFLQQPIVSVRILEFRPVYVLGDVRNPGAFPYRHGASVLSAISMAGGYGLPQQQSLARTEFLAADERVRALEATRRALMIRRARLEAQQMDASEFEVDMLPAELDGHLTRQAAGERQILATEQAAYRLEQSLLSAQKPRLQEEIKNVQEQSRHEARQLTLIQQHLEDYNKLLVSGLARRYTGIELMREEARNKGNIARFDADVARLEIAIGDVAIRAAQAESAYRRRVMAELQETRTRLQDAETALPTAREIRAARLQQGGGLATREGISRAAGVTILRAHRNAVERLEASDTTPLQPGDVIEVRRESAEQPATTAALAPSPPGRAPAMPQRGPAQPDAR